MTTTPDLQGALAAMQAAKRGPHRRSPLTDWLAANYNELDVAFRATPPAWAALARYLAEGGIMGGDGKPPTPIAVRSAWIRLQAEATRRARPMSQHCADPDRDWAADSPPDRTVKATVQPVGPKRYDDSGEDN